jgi:hypothetical protein
MFSAGELAVAEVLGLEAEAVVLGPLTIWRRARRRP